MKYHFLVAKDMLMRTVTVSLSDHSLCVELMMRIPFSTGVKMMRSPSRTIIGMKSNVTQARRRVSCSKYHRKLFTEQNPYGHTKCTTNKGATQSIETKEMGG